MKHNWRRKDRGLGTTEKKEEHKKAVPRRRLRVVKNYHRGKQVNTRGKPKKIHER